MVKQNTLWDFYLTKATKEAEAYELAVGNYKLYNNGSIVPYATNLESTQEFERISSMITSLGAKILTKKLDGIVGTVSIKGSEAIKKHIEDEYEIRSLTEKLARDLIIKGSCGLAIGVDETDTPYVYRLGGFITPIFNPDDIDRVSGILQLMQNDDLTYDVRVFEDNTVSEWKSVRRLQSIDIANPHHQYQNDVNSVAFYVDYSADENNVGKGEIEQIAPILKGIMAVEFRIHRISEIFGYPKMVLSGAPLQDVDNSPTNAIIMNEGGRVEFLKPAEFNQLITQHSHLLKQINELSVLPNGFVGTGNQPSGDAIRESNNAYNASLERYTSNISRLLTNAFWFLCDALGIPKDDLEITITPNKVNDYIADIDTAVALLEKGLLTPEFTVGLIRKKFPGITDEMIDEIVSRYQSVSQLISPEDLLAQV